MITLKSNKGTRQINIDGVPSRYFYAPLFVLDSKFELALFELASVVLNEEQLTYFKSLCREELKKLIENCYKPPTLKNLSMHPGRYELVIFEGKKYHVNILNTKLGKVIYKFDSVIRYSDDIIVEKDSLIISYSNTE